MGGRTRAHTAAIARNLPRADFTDRRAPHLDQRVPALLMKVGAYPMHHGAVGVIRSLGRCGVPVTVVTEDRLTPAALCRWTTNRLLWPVTDTDPARTIGRLIEHATGLGPKPLLVCTDDQAAIMVAEAAETLRDHCLIPEAPPGLTRKLATKQALHELCLEAGIPSPLSAVAHDADELASAVSRLGLPVVCKPTAHDEQGRSVVTRTTLISSDQQLSRLAAELDSGPGCFVQQYLPNESSRDWIVQGYWGPSAETRIIFTGRKLRSSPPFANATALGMTVDNPQLRSLMGAFCEAVGWEGVFDSDWRLDLGSQTYHLVDFNPRVGAQFRLFETQHGIDSIRAMHLVLSGREIPSGRPRDGDRFVVENLALAARLSSTWTPTSPEGAAVTAERPRAAWWSPADPLPMVALAARQAVWSFQERSRRRADNAPSPQPDRCAGDQGVGGGPVTDGRARHGPGSRPDQPGCP